MYADKTARWSSATRAVNSAKVVEYFKTHPCVDCREDDPAVLTFDHVRGKKRNNISNMIGKYSWEEVKKEIEKCDVRCANCHAKKTGRDQKWIKCAG